MTSVRDPFSAVRQAQFEAQLDFFHSMTNQAFESAGRVAALNLATSRDAAERSLGATFALFNSRDPRDFLTLGGQVEEGMRSLFSYSRELLGIASGARAYAVRPLALAQQQSIETVEVIERAAEAAAPVEAAPAPVAEPVVEAVAEAVAEAAPEPVAAPVSTAPVVVVEAEPVVAAAAEPVPVIEPAPVAEPTPIAAAVGQGEVLAAVALHPAAAPVPAADEVPLPKVEVPRASSRRKK